MVDPGLAELYDHWVQKTGNAQAAAIMAAAQLNAGVVVTAEKPLNPADVAKQLRVSPHKVLEWIRSTQLKASNIATGARPRYIIQRSDLDRFLASRQPDPLLGRRKRGAA